MPLRAQTPAGLGQEAGLAEEAKKPRDGFVRFWNLLPKEAGELRLLRERGGAEPEAFASAAPGNTYASYLAVKPDRYALRAVRALDPKSALKNFDLTLKANVFVTFIARIVDRKLVIEMVDDTYDRTTALDGHLTIRQETPDATVNVIAGTQQGAAGLTYGQVARLTGLPMGKPTMLKMTASLANGKRRDWTMEVNFRACPRVTLLLALDPYGRFRPRISPDGQPEMTEPDPVP